MSLHTMWYILEVYLLSNENSKHFFIQNKSPVLWTTKYEIEIDKVEMFVYQFVV